MTKSSYSEHEDQPGIAEITVLLKIISERQEDLKDDIERIYKSTSDNHSKLLGVIQDYGIKIMVTLGVGGVSGIGYFMHYMNKYLMSS